MVHWRSVHPQTDHATFRPTLSIHLTSRLLWHFTNMTFRLKVDGLSVHPKLWHFDLVNLDGLSHCSILSQSLRHFVRVFFVQLCCDISSQRNKRSIFLKNSPIFAHFHGWQLILKGHLKGLSHEISCLFSFWQRHQYFFVDPVTKRPQFAEQAAGHHKCAEIGVTNVHISLKSRLDMGNVLKKSCDKTSTGCWAGGRTSQMSKNNAMKHPPLLKSRLDIANVLGKILWQNVHMSPNSWQYVTNRSKNVVTNRPTFASGKRGHDVTKHFGEGGCYVTSDKLSTLKPGWTKNTWTDHIGGQLSQ